MFLGSHLGDLTEPLTGRSWNHDEVVRRVIARIAYYGEQDVRAATAFYSLRQQPGIFVDLLAVWHLGASLVPVDALLTAFEIENVARRETAPDAG